MLLVTALRWILERLFSIRSDAVDLFPDIGRDVVRQIDAAIALLQVEPILSASALEPRTPELLAIRREGAPWGAVANIAEDLRVLDGSRDLLVARLLIPDDGIRWRLFHLAVLGTVLVGLRDAGCAIFSLHPLSSQVPNLL
jgi:hypothetical protein